ncbi:protein LTO1 homolog isoform X1 [Trachypithecus francoisi]|uniref:protein LTO1 homolog isoform X1 n=1 Tax=Trachypithecus francoisi TaxID=54180 RepID=UPI00141AA649|nr:protein LTO1 homolog isoform X1 [Trachypithecus francoisi]
MAGSQDIFDSIVMADERFHAEGYREGYEEGSSLGVTEGRQHGTLHGAKIGSEIGCYQGFAFAWKCLLHSCTTEKDSFVHYSTFSQTLKLVQKVPDFHSENDGWTETKHRGTDVCVGMFRDARKGQTVLGRPSFSGRGISDLDMKEDMCPRFLPARLLNPAWTQPLREWLHCVGDWSAPAHLAQLLLIHPLQDISIPAVPDLLSPPLFFFPSPISVSCSLPLPPLCLFGTAG